MVNKSADGSAKTNSCTRNALFLMDINFFGVKDQSNEIIKIYISYQLLVTHSQAIEGVQESDVLRDVNHRGGFMVGLFKNDRQSGHKTYIQHPG